jgi:hypothetical protein
MHTAAKWGRQIKTVAGLYPMLCCARMICHSWEPPTLHMHAIKAQCFQ